MDISVIVPVYECEACLHELCIRLKKNITPLGVTYEIILINDGSTDLSWETTVRLARMDKHIKGIRFSKNFGQHHAIEAGLDTAKGSWIIVMDCDLQDRPEEIPRLYNKALEGYDIVLTERQGRHDTLMKKALSYVYNIVFEYLTGIKSNSSIGNFSICKRMVINYLKQMREQNRSYIQSLRWLGFVKTSIPVTHAQRYKGKSTYTFMKMFSYAMGSIVAYSEKPLVLSIQIGFVISFLSFVMGIVVIFRYFIFKIPIVGWTSLIVTLVFSTGLIMLDLGVIGLYIGKIFNETKHRPLYIIQETVGINRKRGNA
jgi:glycosyltransferase involved in cell wall biosynthesis